MQWDLFCRVIDNHGDLGVCWRLARQLCARKQRVRLWIDAAAALKWMAADCPQACQVLAWPEREWQPSGDPTEVVVEAFGCELPAAVQSVLAALQPCWINLEYLSAEDYTLRCHRLPSPILHGPAQGLVKTFWYPGFVPGSGGLLREPGLIEAESAHRPHDFLRSLGLQADAQERVVSLFCYPHAPLADLARALSGRPTLLLACGGNAHALESQGQLRVQSLPWLDQDAYDHLLWSCDLNIVRGEDSFVRAQWAGRPMLWHIYQQDDGAHIAKLEAYLALRWPKEGAAEPALWRAWNRLPGSPPLAFEAPGLWDREEALAWRAQLLAQTDLCAQLLEFAASRTVGSGGAEARI